MIKLPELGKYCPREKEPESWVIYPLKGGCLTEADADEIIRRVEQYNPWIPVSERLPEKTEEDLRPEVLVYDGESVTGALWRHYGSGPASRWDFETDRGKPTHWKPIILPDAEAEK